MIGKILGSGQLGKLASFVSPTFFDVMPARALLHRAKTLRAASRDGSKVRDVLNRRASELAERMPALRLNLPLRSDAASEKASQSPAVSAWRASLVAELYFRQLFVNGPTLLDLRATAFSTDGKSLIWSPAAWIADFSPEFIGPLREIYVGFYDHDDARFRHGLAQLGLLHSEDLFREQFGDGQAQVVFNVRAFIDVFHRVFERCKHNKTSLHPDFLPLGIYLAALYDHEQELAVPVNVAEAFHTATAEIGATTQTDVGAVQQEPNHA